MACGGGYEHRNPGKLFWRPVAPERYLRLHLSTDLLDRDVQSLRP
jgi:hypothetical protein